MLRISEAGKLIRFWVRARRMVGFSLLVKLQVERVPIYITYTARTGILRNDFAPGITGEKEIDNMASEVKKHAGNSV